MNGYGNSLRQLARQIYERNVRLGRTRSQAPALKEIVADRYLIEVFDDLARIGGQAPGEDGYRYRDFGRIDRARILTRVSKRIRSGRYLPGPVRAVPISKRDGGTRTLHLPNIIDRVVYTALNRKLSPFWETIFSPRSHGFRRERGVCTMLAALEAEVVQKNLWTLVIDDIRKAFDNVRADVAMAAHQKHISNTELLSFIETVIQGHTGPRRNKGIDQGGAYSPTALNVVLHEVLDKPLFQERQRSGQRYADNIVLACTDLTEGNDVHKEARLLLAEAGLTFKGGDAHNIVDLQRGDRVHLLGLNIRKGDKTLVFHTDETAWDDLAMHIQDCHAWDDPPETARTVVRSWVSSQGPALANWGDADLDRILTIGNTHGIREIISRESYQTTRWTAMYRWDQLRRTTHTGGRVDYRYTRPRDR